MNMDGNIYMRSFDNILDGFTGDAMKFSMPYEQLLEIRPSRDIDDIEDPNVEIEGVTWHIFWGNEEMPFHTKTKAHAISIALGCQWGALGMKERYPIDASRHDDEQF